METNELQEVIPARIPGLVAAVGAAKMPVLNSGAKLEAGSDIKRGAGTGFGVKGRTILVSVWASTAQGAKASDGPFPALTLLEEESIPVLRFAVCTDSTPVLKRRGGIVPRDIVYYKKGE